MKKIIEKKIFITLLIINMICLNIIPVTVTRAAGNAAFSIEQTTAKNDETVTLNIMMNSLSGATLGAYSYDITYDTSKLEVVKDESSFFSGGILGGLNTVNFSQTGKITVAGMDTAGTTKTGKIAQVTFKVKSNAEGIATVGMSITKLIEPSLEKIESVISNSGKITIEEKITSITLNKTSLTLNKGESETLTASEADVVWSSSDSSIASVSNGKVTALKGGTVKITAKYDDITATCQVTVKSPLIGFSVNKSSMSLNVGSSQTLTTSFNPTDTTDDKTVTWSSSNTAVASVTDGKVMGRSSGTATITAKCGNYTSTCVVYVSRESSNTTTNTTGNNTSTNTTVNNTTGNNTSTNTTVNNTTGNNTSTNTTVNNTTENTTTDTNIQNETEEENVEEEAEDEVEGFESYVYIQEGNQTMLTNEEKQLTLDYNAEEGLEIVWNSSNSEIAEVSKNGMIYAKKEGAVVISVVIGTDVDSINVIVEEGEAEIEAVTIVKEDEKYEIGKQYILEYLVQPEHLYDDLDIQWKISNEGTATISEKGVITPLKKGFATVALYVEGEVEDRYEIEIINGIADTKKTYVTWAVGIILGNILLMQLGAYRYIRRKRRQLKEANYETEEEY